MRIARVGNGRLWHAVSRDIDGHEQGVHPRGNQANRQCKRWGPIGEREVRVRDGSQSDRLVRKILGSLERRQGEAGLAPNQLRGAYDEMELLDRYAKLAHELGRMPTGGDLRLKTHSDSVSRATIRSTGSAQRQGSSHGFSISVEPTPDTKT